MYIYIYIYIYVHTHVHIIYKYDTHIPGWGGHGAVRARALLAKPQLCNIPPFRPTLLCKHFPSEPSSLLAVRSFVMRQALAHIHIHLHTRIPLSLYIYIHIYIYIYTHMCIHIYMYVYICIYIYICLLLESGMYRAWLGAASIDIIRFTISKCC